MKHRNEQQAESTGYDYIVIGSGFGGAVSALRLAEKGYRVLVIEKGRWFRAEDFPRHNWQLRRWLWAPRLGWRGIFKMTFLNHITVLSGVGVGGGSLTYANTLPVPKPAFFHSGNWQGLADWEGELRPFYELAYRMLGAAENPRFGPADHAVGQLATELDRTGHFGPTRVAVFFGEPGKTVPDPYFGGRGPERAGCIHCGACMTGCRHNAKNTLDKNYLHLAQQLGVEILAEREVRDVEPLDGAGGATGYRVRFRGPGGRGEATARGVVFAGGVLGTVPLLLRLKERSLPRLSDQVGNHVRTNNEALVCVVSRDEKKDFTEGIAIGSILHTDEHSHLEPTRYGPGSGFFRLLLLPMAFGRHFPARLGRMIGGVLAAPGRFFRALLTRDFAHRTTILLFMQHLDSTIRLRRGRLTPLRTTAGDGPRPSAFIPHAGELTGRFERLVDGKAFVSFLETTLGIPTTAHILGGAVIGADAGSGVIDRDHRVFGYENMLVCDGAAVSANPGVNPALTITAMAERAMSRMPAKAVPAGAADQELLA